MNSGTCVHSSNRSFIIRASSEMARSVALFASRHLGHGGISRVHRAIRNSDPPTTVSRRGAAWSWIVSILTGRRPPTRSRVTTATHARGATQDLSRPYPRDTMTVCPPSRYVRFEVLAAGASRRSRPLQPRRRSRGLAASCIHQNSRSPLPNAVRSCRQARELPHSRRIAGSYRI